MTVMAKSRPPIHQRKRRMGRRGGIEPLSDCLTCSGRPIDMDEYSRTSNIQHPTSREDPRAKAQVPAGNVERVCPERAAASTRRHPGALRTDAVRHGSYGARYGRLSGG